VQNLVPPGGLQETFSYTLTDTDGDDDQANLVITVSDADQGVVITNLTPELNGGDVTVDEDDLAEGTDSSKESLTQTGDFTISAPDGVGNLTVGGLQVIVNGVYQGNGIASTTPLGNTLTITAYNATTGVVSYSYTLGNNETHASANGQNSLFENLAVVLTDLDGDQDTDALSVNIVDDVPVVSAPDGSLQNDTNETLTGLLVYTIGADEPGQIDLNAPTVTSNGAPIAGGLKSHGDAILYAVVDTNGDGLEELYGYVETNNQTGYQLADREVFTLAPSGGANGQSGDYTLTMNDVVDLPVESVTLNFTNIFSPNQIDDRLPQRAIQSAYF
jgi:hypothetical protein